MTTTSLSKASLPALRCTLVAAAIAGASASGWAANPQFTINPAGAGLAGTLVVADAFNLSDVSTVTLSGPTFTETGFLPVQSLLLNNSTVLSPGLNTSYGLYFVFSGGGATPNVPGPFNPGTLTATYQLYGYSGSAATFGFNPSHVPTINGFTTPIGTLLASGATTTPGTVLSLGGTNVTSVDLSFSRTNPAGTGFFPLPLTFYNRANANFSNGPANVTSFNGGFEINGGSGSFIFAPVPEPETYAMMLAGLVAVGFVAKRRKI